LKRRATSSAKRRTTTSAKKRPTMNMKKKTLVNAKEKTSANVNKRAIIKQRGTTSSMKESRNKHEEKLGLTVSGLSWSSSPVLFWL
jgi:hypothetical protein